MENIQDKTSDNSPKRAEDGKLLSGGPSLNPSGRPKGSISITDAIKRKLEEEFPGGDNEEKRTYLDKIVEAIMHNALTVKDTATLKGIWNYIDGMPKQNIGIGVDKEDLAGLTEFFRSIGKKKDE